jgi:hypothetical protein
MTGDDLIERRLQRERAENADRLRLRGRRRDARRQPNQAQQETARNRP